MPVKLSELIKTKTIMLPVSGATLTVATAVPAYIATSVQSVEGDEEKVYVIMENIVKSWDIVDEGGNPVPVTGDVIKQLSGADIKYLTEQSLGETNTP